MKRSVIYLIICFTHCSVMAQWVKLNCPFYPNTLAVHDGFLFEGSDEGIARSFNGSDWKIMNNGLHGDMQPSPVLSFFSIGKNLIAGANYMEGLFISSDDGNLWTRIHTISSPDQ